MDFIQSNFNFSKLNILANQIVEGFMSGIHKSPLYGYSSEFNEHKLYNKGENTKYIDWKLFAKTNKLYIKKFEDETNLRSHFILDHSSSMHYPTVDNFSLDKLSKFTFSSLSVLAIINILLKQSDGFGLSLYAEGLDFSVTEKSSYKQLQYITQTLQNAFLEKKTTKKTDALKSIHYIAEKLKRRSLVFMFSDMLHPDNKMDDIFDALKHLKYNKHQVVLFHTTDFSKEINFEFNALPRRFIDVESNKKIDLYPEQLKEVYRKMALSHRDEILNKCRQYKISYVNADINKGFEKVILTYLLEKQKY